jgi:hypothetical protein
MGGTRGVVRSLKGLTALGSYNRAEKLIVRGGGALSTLSVIDFFVHGWDLASTISHPFSKCHSISDCWTILHQMSGPEAVGLAMYALLLGLHVAVPIATVSYIAIKKLRQRPAPKHANDNHVTHSPALVLRRCLRINAADYVCDCDDGGVGCRTAKEIG